MLCKLKGVSFYQTTIDDIEEGETVLLKVDEESEYDNKPVICTNKKGEKLGCIGKEQKEEVSNLMEKKYKVKVQKIHKLEGPSGVCIKIESK